MNEAGSPLLLWDGGRWKSEVATTNLKYLRASPSTYRCYHQRGPDHDREEFQIDRASYFRAGIVVLEEWEGSRPAEQQKWRSCRCDQSGNPKRAAHLVSSAYSCQLDE